MLDPDARLISRFVVKLTMPPPVTARSLFVVDRLIVLVAFAARLLSVANVNGPVNVTALNSDPAVPIVNPAVMPEATRSRTVRLSVVLPGLILSELVGFVNSVYSNERGTVLS